MNKTVTSYNFLIFRAPHKQLFEAVGFRQGIEFININRLACPSSLHGKRYFAQAPYFLHNIGRKMGRSDIDVLTTIVGVTEEVLVRQLSLNQRFVHRWYYI